MSLSYFPVSTAANAAKVAEPSTEAQHLRRVLDTQPACLMRVGIDGHLLAANDAALALLGVADRSVALGATLMTWMAPQDCDRWRHFAERVVAGTRSSLECDLKTSDGETHNVVFHSVPLMDHADGVPSMILAIRDVSAVHRLEMALQEREVPQRSSQPDPGEASKPAQEELEKLVRLLKEGRKHLQDLRSQLEETGAERNRLTAEFAGKRANRAASQHELASAQARADQAVAERLELVQKHELELQRKEQEWQHTCETLRADLDALTTSRERLENELRDRENASQQLIAAHAQAEQMLAQQHELELQLEEQERQQQLDAARADLEGVRTNLEQTIRDRDRALLDRDQVVLERDQMVRDRDQAILDRDQIIRDRDEIIVDRDQISRERDQIARDRDEARSQQDEWNRERRQLSEDLAAERSKLEEIVEMADAARHASDRERANFRVELDGAHAAARQLTPMAAAGRLAIDVAGELTTLVGKIDARTSQLLGESTLDTAFRKDVEALRADTILAQSLAAQILQRRLDEAPDPEESA
jgi:PAS domain S-box-containing protein